MVRLGYAKLPLLTTLFAVVLGCGGSGSQPGPPVYPATKMRVNVPGDSWTYSVTTSLPFIGYGSGTYKQSLSNDTYLGDPTIRSAEQFSLTYPNGPVDLADYSEISTKGVLLAVISQGVLTPVKSETLAPTGIYSSSTHFSGVLTLIDGTVQQQDYRVVGAQNVTVPAGTFACWVVKETTSRNDGTHDYFTLYVDPTLGNWVKGDAQIKYGGGQEFDWHAELTSMVTATVSTHQLASGTPPLTGLERLVPETRPSK